MSCVSSNWCCLSADVMVNPAGVTPHCSPKPRFGDTFRSLSRMRVDNARRMLVMKDRSDLNGFTVGSQLQTLRNVTWLMSSGFRKAFYLLLFLANLMLFNCATLHISFILIIEKTQRDSHLHPNHHMELEDSSGNICTRIINWLLVTSCPHTSSKYELYVAQQSC